MLLKETYRKNIVFENNKIPTHSTSISTQILDR